MVRSCIMHRKSGKQVQIRRSQMKRQTIWEIWYLLDNNFKINAREIQCEDVD
jgi:hypothetical protein